MFEIIYYGLHILAQILIVIYLLVMLVWFAIHHINKRKQWKKLEGALLVRLTGNTYASGETIPRWVRNDTFVVSSITKEYVQIAKPVGWVPIDDVEIIETKEAEGMI